MKRGGGSGHHRQVDETGDGHGDGDVDFGGGIALRLIVLTADLGKRRMQIDHVRHDGGTQYPGGQKYRIAVRQIGQRHPLQQRRKLRLRECQLDDVSGGDEQQQAANHPFQRLLPAFLQHQN